MDYEEFVKKVVKRMKKEDKELLAEINDELSKSIESADIDFLNWFADMFDYHYHYSIWFGFDKAYQNLISRLRMKIRHRKEARERAYERAKTEVMRWSMR